MCRRGYPAVAILIALLALAPTRVQAARVTSMEFCAMVTESARTCPDVAARFAPAACTDVSGRRRAVRSSDTGNPRGRDPGGRGACGPGERHVGGRGRDGRPGLRDRVFRAGGLRRSGGHRSLLLDQAQPRLARRDVPARCVRAGAVHRQRLLCGRGPSRNAIFRAGARGKGRGERGWGS
jgi:hypothetical protein